MSDDEPVVKNDENDELFFKINPDGTVTISKETFDNLMNDSMMFQALEETGVENWEGYDDAMDIYQALCNEEY